MYRIYERTLKFVLRHPLWTLTAAAAVLALTVKLFLILPTGFLPDQDMDEVVAKPLNIAELIQAIERVRRIAEDAALAQPEAARRPKA